MFSTRILPPAEWHRLGGTESAPFATAAPDAAVNPLVVEDEGVIVGTWTLTAYHVVEGLWVHPDYRQRIGVARAIVREMRRFAQHQGVAQALTFSIDPAVDRLLETYGATRLLVEGFAPVPYVVPFKETSCRQ